MSDMEVSDSSRSPSPQPRPQKPQPQTVPLEEFLALKRQNDDLIQELKSLRQLVEKLTASPPQASAPVQASASVQASAPALTKNKRRKKNPISSDSSSEDEESPRPTPPTQRPAQVSQVPQVPERTKEARTTQAPSTSTEEAPRSPRIPPVILRKQERWTEVRKMLDEKRIRFEKARLIADGVAITAATPDDFRKMTATFNQAREEYHTYTLAEDRQLRVVIRGLPTGTTVQEIQEDLREQGFPEAKVQRMTSRRTRMEMPLVLVQVPHTQVAILDVKRCCSLVVRVERQRVQQEATQCHRCQRFGHGQSRCTATPKCVKCGQEHATATCTKAREEPAKCANCGGEHPASYRGCPKFPKGQRKPQAEARKTPASQQARQPPAAPRREGFSYAAAAKAANAEPQARTQKVGQTSTGRDVAASQMMAQFQQMFDAMKTFYTQLSPMFQV